MVVNYSCKKFYNIGTWCRRWKLFSSSPMAVDDNKLERFSAAKF